MLNKIIFLSLFSILAIIFHTNGWIDLMVSSEFYNSTRGFYLKDNWFVMLVYKIVPVIVIIFILVAMLLALRIFLKTKSLDPRYYIRIIYVILVCIVGPGLVVNGVFKENFGRARPIQIQEFGGNAKFTPAFVIANQCQHNCSFVSGHASIGFMFFAFAFINHGRRRVYYNILSLGLGAVFGLGRIMQGAHFLSDVIFSGFFVYITAYILSWAFCQFSPYREFFTNKKTNDIN